MKLYRIRKGRKKDKHGNNLIFYLFHKRPYIANVGVFIYKVCCFMSWMSNGKIYTSFSPCLFPLFLVGRMKKYGDDLNIRLIRNDSHKAIPKSIMEGIINDYG